MFQPNRRLLFVLAISFFSGCAAPELVSERYFPVGHGNNQTVNRTVAAGWSTEEKGQFSSAEAILSGAADYVGTKIRLTNTDSDEPIWISRIYMSDANGTLLKSDTAERISAEYSGEAARLRGESRDAAEATNSAIRKYRTTHSDLEKGAVVAEGVASAILAGMNASAANTAQDAAKYVLENSYENQLISKGLANEGLVFFMKGDRIQPFTLHIQISNGVKNEEFAFEYNNGQPSELYTYLLSLPEGDWSPFLDWIGHTKREDLRMHVGALDHKAICKTKTTECRLIRFIGWHSDFNYSDPLSN